MTVYDTGRHIPHMPVLFPVDLKPVCYPCRMAFALQNIFSLSESLQRSLDFYVVKKEKQRKKKMKKKKHQQRSLKLQ